LNASTEERAPEGEMEEGKRDGDVLAVSRRGAAEVAVKTNPRETRIGNNLVEANFTPRCQIRLLRYRFKTILDTRNSAVNLRGV